MSDIEKVSHEPLDNILYQLREHSGTTGFKYSFVNLEGKIVLSSVPEFEIGMTLDFPKHQDTYYLNLLETLSDGEYKYAVLKYEAEGI